ncbi:GTP-binding protein GEM-like [Octopus vulgaris]|uniref:GTP-binding protein GEM-like n=1 Tax=Octopus vulgaris TaxID=6645 RepID=A0AA36FH50_OCTVU|nr:GTP-binding protein GEM-like [Octopus vulgaris]
MTQDKQEDQHRCDRRVSVCSSSSSNNSNNSLCKEYLLSARMSPSREAVSAPHSRSCSFRNKPRSREVEMLGARPRTNSMPNPDPIYLSVSCENIGDRPTGGLYRVRSFTKTPKGLVNRGDSFKKRSNNSVMSSGSTITDHNEQCGGGSDRGTRSRTLSVASSQGSNSCSGSSTTAPSYFRQVILGASGVGKTSILRQFMTSEYMGVVENTEADWENTVSVLLDGEESTMEFTDGFDENYLENMNFDGYLVVYSITDRSSYKSAIDILHLLRQDMGSDRAVILVANKIDLVRKREVSSDEARSIAVNYDCKYIETSAALNHQIDDLLVGSLSQIRLKLNIHVQENSQTLTNKKNKNRRTKTRRSLISKIFKKNSRKVKSCDNLFDL